MKEYTKEELEQYLPQLFKENPNTEAFYADKAGNFRTAEQLEAVANKDDFEFKFANPAYKAEEAAEAEATPAIEAAPEVEAEEVTAEIEAAPEEVEAEPAPAKKSNPKKGK